MWVKKIWWVLIPIIIAGVVLSSSVRLGKFEELVTTHVQNSLSTSILQQTYEKYPTLSEQEVRDIAKKRIKETLKDPKTKEKIRKITEEQKKQFQDKDGTPYILEPDAYYYLRYADNIIAHGHPGETLKNGKPFDLLRKAPNGLAAPWSLLPIVEAYWHKIWNIFSSASLLKTSFYLPVALGMLSTALIFFITLTIFKNIETALFASIFFAVHPYLFRQNMAGFTDTPSLIMPISLAFFLSVLWLIEGKTKQRIIAGISAIIFLFALKYTWSGWFFAPGIAAAFCIALAFFTILKQKNWKNAIAAGIGGIIIALVMYKLGYIRKILTKLQFTEKIQGLQATVKELARPTFQELVQALGDRFFSIIVLCAAVWMAAKVIKRNITNGELFLFVWFIVLIIPATRILRFMFFLLPPAVILAGWLVQKARVSITKFVSDFHVASPKIVSIVLIIILPAAVGATMIDIKNMPLPPMNAAKAETADWFTENTSTEAIINTWWDYGYIWQYAAKRATVLDAGPNAAAYWMADALLSENETYANNVFRMLACGNTNAHYAYRGKYGAKGVSMLSDVLNSHEQADPEFANLTNCTPPETYVIVDKNMYDITLTLDSIASWNVELGTIHTLTENMTREQAVDYLKENLQINETKAEKMYDEAQIHTITPPNTKISVIQTCDKTNATVLECSEYTVDIEQMTAVRKGKSPQSLTIYNEGNRTQTTFPEGKEIALIIFKDEEDVYRSLLVSPKYMNTILIRLFAEDTFEHFSIAHRSFAPERILTWKINWNDTNEEPVQP